MDRHGPTIDEAMTTALRAAARELHPDPLKRIGELFTSYALERACAPQGKAPLSLTDTLAGFHATGPADPITQAFLNSRDPMQRDGSHAAGSNVSSSHSSFRKSKGPMGSGTMRSDLLSGLEGLADQDRPTPAVFVPMRRRRKSREMSEGDDEDPTAVMDAELERAFAEMDTDGSGTLDPSELRAAFELAGRPGEHAATRARLAEANTPLPPFLAATAFRGAMLTARGAVRRSKRRDYRESLQIDRHKQCARPPRWHVCWKTISTAPFTHHRLHTPRR